MAKKPASAIIKDGIFWLDIAVAAKRLGTIERKMIERALAGEFRYLESNGVPVRVAEPDIAPLRTAKLAADRARAAAAPRAKSPKQQEAAWAKLAADNERKAGTGDMFFSFYLRTMAEPEKPK